MAKRPNILKLATKISLESMTYMGITYDDPEYKILEPIIDDDMCAIMMHLRLEANRTVEDVAKRARKSVEYTQEQLDKLCKTGAVRYRYVDGKRCYFYPIWVPGIMEGILANREQCDKYPVLGESFEAYTRRRPEMLAPMLDSGKTGMFFMRVMPVMSAIENNSRTASYDELKTLIDNATAISVGPCSCRRARRLMGEGCGHLEEDMCMYLNDNALCFSEQGYHRLVSKEEAYEILQRAEDNGLVHEINQTPGFEDATAICNCCGCSCFALRIGELFRTPRAIRSNYIARVDKEKCVACGQCVENCQTNALKLGQKRCATDPHISDTYDTDASVPFHRSSYNPEYRTNRSDVMPSGTAPCKAVCPLNIPVQGCLQLLSVGRYDDAAALEELCRRSDVVTYEFENVDAGAIDEVRGITATPQGTDLLRVTQHRVREKQFINDHGTATAPWRAVNNFDELDAALGDIHYPAVLKTVSGGYDGHGQLVLRSDADLEKIRSRSDRGGGFPPSILEGFVDFAFEASILVSGNGKDFVTFPIVRNEHRNNILHMTIAPAEVSEHVAREAHELAIRLAKGFELAGTLAIELFITKDDQVIVNELAPRPHNSGHYTIEACSMDQFDAHIRGIAGWPLPKPKLLSPAVMVNVLGQHVEPTRALIATHPEWNVHDYGKAEVRHDRKMGHITVLTDDPAKTVADLEATGCWDDLKKKA